MSSANHTVQPLADMEEWDEFLVGRYKEGKSEAEFRQYDATATPGVAEFYRQNHEGQTVAYVLEKEKQYSGLNKGMKTIWEAAEFLNTLVDDSDPDTDLTQIEHHVSQLIDLPVLIRLHAQDGGMAHSFHDLKHVPGFPHCRCPEGMPAQIGNQLGVRPCADTSSLEAVRDRIEMSMLASTGAGREQPARSF